MLFLFAILLLGLVGFAALGVEDNRFHDNWTPVLYQTMSPHMMRWEDGLPGRPSLPWVQSTAEWIESEGK